MFIPDVRRPNMTVEILQTAEGRPEAHKHPDTSKSGELRKFHHPVEKAPDLMQFQVRCFFLCWNNIKTVRNPQKAECILHRPLDQIACRPPHTHQKAASQVKTALHASV